MVYRKVTEEVEHSVANCKPCNNCYSHRGCRCSNCRAARREWENTAVIRRIVTRNPNRRVPIKEAQNHLLYLATHGIGVKFIARQTGLSSANLQRIRSGRCKFISKAMEDKIMALATTQFEPPNRVKKLVKNTFTAPDKPKPYLSNYI